MSFPFSVPFNPFGDNSPIGVITPGKIMQLATDLQSVKWYYTAMASLLAYDYVLTFSTEMRYVWREKRTIGFWLFLWVRYFPMCFCAIMLVSYFSPSWTFEICNRFAPAIWAQTVLIFVPCEILMALRVYALSKRNIWIVTPLIMVTLAQFSVSIYIFSSGDIGALPVARVPLKLDGFHICMLYPTPAIKNYALAFIGLNVGFDSAVFVLTLGYTLRAARLGKNPLIEAMRRDGILYFFGLFSANFVWMMMLVYGRPGLKFINAQPSHLFTSIMICRLSLSLREANGNPHVITSWGSDTYKGNNNRSGLSTMTVEERMDFASHEMAPVGDNTTYVGQKKKKAWEGKLSESEASSDGTFSRTSHA